MGVQKLSLVSTPHLHLTVSVLAVRFTAFNKKW